MASHCNTVPLRHPRERSPTSPVLASWCGARRTALDVWIDMPGGRPRFRLSRSLLWPALAGTLVLVVVSAGAVAAIETDTVTSFWRGLWWSISLVTTVGFIGQPPTTDAGAALSVVLMVVGFVLLASVSASLAALFVRDDQRPRAVREETTEDATLAALKSLELRLASIESRLAHQSTAPTDPIRGSTDEAVQSHGPPARPTEG